MSSLLPLARCYLCNDLETGEGEQLPAAAFIANILDSQCRYCRMVVQAVNKLVPDFWSRPGQKSGAQAMIKRQVRILAPGLVHLVLSGGEVPTNEDLELEFFHPADYDAHDSLDGVLKFSIRVEHALVARDPSMWKFLRSTLKTCLEEYSACTRTQTPHWFPEGLVAIQVDPDGYPVCRLIETRQQLPNSAYIALSHCWGSNKVLCTTSKNLKSHRDQIKYSNLPRTFQDAVTVARELQVSGSIASALPKIKRTTGHDMLGKWIKSTKTCCSSSPPYHLPLLPCHF
jgi:hypothetical protein